MKTYAALTVCLLPMLTAMAAPKPLVYLPFDRGTIVGVGRIGAESVLPDLPAQQPAGVRGECLMVGTDLRLTAEDNFNPAEGTVSFWIRPAWKRQDIAQPHTLFCLYGGENPAWARSRWSIWANHERISATIYPDKGQRGVSLEAPWNPRKNAWCHVAWTWKNISSGKPDAELALFLDGKPVARKSGLQINVGKIGRLIDIGRDSDASPDYANAEYDEFYIYGAALSAPTVLAAVEAQREPAAQQDPPTSVSPLSPSWPDPQRMCRFTATVKLPAGPPGAVTVCIPFGVQNDLTQLGLEAALELDTLLVRETTGASDIPHAFAGNDLLLEVVTDGKPQTRQFVAYFALHTYDFTVPLMARMRTHAPPRADATKPFQYADFAQTTYDDAWDFDEGDTEAIDQWGNAPWCLKNRRVQGGVLRMDVSEDPWFVWGDIWKQIKGGTKRPVAIDLEHFNLLEMRVRQSCPGAEWTVFGLPKGGALRSYKFNVKGTGWQTLRIDLREQAGFHGTLEALRIDPTSHIKEAHIEIDWVRITRSAAGTRGAVEVGPLGTVAPAKLAIHAGPTRVPVGSRHVVNVVALDDAGRPVPCWPLRLLVTGRGATLGSAPRCASLLMPDGGRRAITNDDGEVEVTIHCSPKAGESATRLSVLAEFAERAKASLAWDGQEGPPHHYRVSPPNACVVRENDLPLEVTALLVDAQDNPLTIKGRRVSALLPNAMSTTTTTAVTDAQGTAHLKVNFNLTKRWVGNVEVKDEQGLTGRSAPISIALDTPLRFTYRVLPNGYFATTDGKPFVPLGGFYANWVQSETPDGEWSQCNPFHATTEDQKRVWLSKLAERGVTSLRFMLRTHRRDPGMQGTEALDAGGRVNRRLFSEILRYMDLAREYNIVFLAVVHDDYYKPVYCDRNNYSRFTRPAFAGIDIDALPPFQRRFVRDGQLLKEVAWKYTDPDAMACQDLYVRELTSFLRNCPAIFAYELENEMVNCPTPWANHAIAELRKGDPARAVCASHGGGGLFTADPLWWHEKTDIDFYTYHLYPHSSRCTTPEIDYGLAADILTRYGRMCGTSFLGESSGDQFRYDTDRERRRRVMRDLIWLSLTNGNPGCFFWNARLSEVAEFAAARDAMSRLDLLTFERAKPEIAVLVSHPLNDDKYYRNTEQGRKDYDMMGRYCRHYNQLGVDMDFAIPPEGHTQTADLKRFAPPVPKRRPLVASAGLETTYLARTDWSEVLIYIRNVAGIEPVELKHGRGKSLQHLRTRNPLDWRLNLDLPKGDYTAHVYDLDTGKTADHEVSGDGAIVLGATDHDIAIVLKRR